jgi:hypothetical protein
MWALVDRTKSPVLEVLEMGLVWYHRLSWLIAERCGSSDLAALGLELEGWQAERNAIAAGAVCPEGPWS